MVLLPQRWAVDFPARGAGGFDTPFSHSAARAVNEGSGFGIDFPPRTILPHASKDQVERLPSSVSHNTGVYVQHGGGVRRSVIPT